MRLQREEKIVMVLLLMALGSLAVGFWAFRTEDASQEVTVDGAVLDVSPTRSGGHLILRLDSTSMPIFIPSDAGAGDVQMRVDPGDRVRVRGTISEYQGKEELKVSKATDVVVMGPQ